LGVHIWQIADLLMERPMMMILRAILFAVCLALAGVAPPQADAQTFNCRTARLPAERAICNDGILAQLDVQMSNLYFALINRVGPQTARIIRDDQRAWLQARNSCGYNIGCLDGEYRRRIGELMSY
jgi:uncharacterized protein